MPPFAVFRVELTPKGENLVKAWLAGSPDALTNSLAAGEREVR
jgi:hypothetical protein